MSTRSKKSKSKDIPELCRCPPGFQKLCRKKAIESGKDIKEIIEALEYQADVLKKSKVKVPKFKLKPFKQKHYKDTCVPMAPSMHTRLRYIGHCDPAPPRQRPRSNLELFDYPTDSEIEEEGPYSKCKRRTDRKKKVRYSDLCYCPILMNVPPHVVQHTDSDKSILDVNSPNVSGENITVQKAAVRPVELKPPIPAKSGFDLYRPHSGIVINQGRTFVPNITPFAGPPLEGSSRRKKGKTKPCYKMGTCPKKKCSKKCRKNAKMHEKRQLARSSKSRTCSSFLSSVGGGARDGKPRAKSMQRQLGDDDVCGLDEIPRPEQIFLPANLKKGMIKTHSLTVLPCKKSKKTDISYGILLGTFNMYDSKFVSRSRGRQALAMSVMSYCLAFHYHPKQWTMKLVDNLIDAGDQWYLQCLDKVHDHSSVQGMCEVLPFGKKQIVSLNGKKMQVLLCEPDIVGYTMSMDPTVYNLCRGLIAFFQDNRAGVLMTRILKVVIWKDKVCYYMFDPAGRNSRAFSNFSSGGAALVNVQDVASIAELLLARSILEDQKYVLAPVKVLKMVDEAADEDLESDKEMTQAEKAMLGYRILAANCAIVNANMHLGDRCFEDCKYRQALPIAIVAMTYAKISPPNTWFTKTLDKILRLGNKLYLDCVQPKVLTDLTIDNIPNEIAIGPYACEIIIYRERAKGQLFTTKECIFNIKAGLKDFFSHEYSSGILEFNNYSLAIWKQKDMYYLFDPYPRTNYGLRAIKTGKACCWMLLDTDAMAEVIINNFDYLPATNQFYIHAFKVLKLKKQSLKTQIVCTLSASQLPGARNVKREVLEATRAQGDGLYGDALPKDILDIKGAAPVDEELMGDIVSLIDSIQDDYVPHVPMKYKNWPEEEIEQKTINLDSPTVSVTQVIPPWPKPRDKTNEPPDIDPEYEPTPPPTPPPPPPPEGAEEADEEELDEEAMEAKMEEEKRKKEEEEEARRKAEELPPPLPPPPPSPQPEMEEVPLAHPIAPAMEDEMQTAEHETIDVDRKVLLTADARKRFKLRQIRKKMTAPLTETELEGSPSDELLKPNNFKDLPDNSQIIKGTQGITADDAIEHLPFVSIIAIVTSYKYSINTWSTNIVNFVVDTAKKLHSNKKEKFQFAPVHIIPKIKIGHQGYNANIDVVGEGATWQLEDILKNKFLLKYDRGMITTSHYSCAFFEKNGLYYLFDGSTCNPMGLRANKGNACLLRFRKLHDLVSRVLFNKDGKTEDQQFILSRIVVRRLLVEPRYKLPEDYNYETEKPESKKSKLTLAEKKEKSAQELEEGTEEPEGPLGPVSPTGYQLINGIYRIEGTTDLGSRCPASEIKSCHFVCLIAMLMAAMHPHREWNQMMVDTCIEKGREIYDKAQNLNTCEKRVIKNIILDGKFININIKKIIVINDNPVKTIEQYLRAVLNRLRYVIVKFPECSFVICKSEGYYHLFDAYAPVKEDPVTNVDAKQKRKNILRDPGAVATWTLYRDLEGVMTRLEKTLPALSLENPEFYTFQLTSVKTAPRHAALNYRLSPLFKPDENPNVPYLRKRKMRPNVDEKMYWLDIQMIPWSRMSPYNDLGLERNTPKTMWKDWDIEFPGDLFSLWGTVHPKDNRFPKEYRGKQYLCTCVIAVVMTEACQLNAWTGSLLDGIVIAGNKYFEKCVAKIGNNPNHEMVIEDLDTSNSDDLYPYQFSFKYENVIFGFLYNMHSDRFNLSKAMSFFFEKHKKGILVSPTKNIAFGKINSSYFLYDCQSYGAPVFNPGQGGTYMLKCESLNRLVYCTTLALNVRRHGHQFHLYSLQVTVAEKK